MSTLQVFSFGGGVQSMACLVLAAQGEFLVKTFLFANVGSDSENPHTLEYFSQIALPFAKRYGIALIEVQKIRRNGKSDTLYQTLTKANSRSIPIPMRMGTNGAPGNRACTIDFKIGVVAKWIKEQGATREEPAMVHLGISLDEFQRMKQSQIPYQVNVYPLIDRRKSRQDCMNIIQGAGLPVPPKSSCWFCPYHRMSVWGEMADTEPELFHRACDLESTINERRIKLGRDAVWLSGKLKPLAQAVGDMSQGKLFDVEPTCDSGFCIV